MTHTHTHTQQIEGLDPIERKRLQVEAIATYRPFVAKFVRSYVRDPQHWSEAEQVGCIGLLMALAKFDPSMCGEDRGAAFWNFATRYVRDEIRTWMDKGVYWRPSANRGTSPARKAAAEVAKLQRNVASFETIEEYAPIACELPSPESLVADAEAAARLASFVATLSDDDKANLLTENSQRVRSRHHLSLVKRATAFVKGANGDVLDND